MGEPSRNGPRLSHAAHWASFSARWDGDRLDVTPRPGDPDPSPILGNFTDVLRHKARILKPMVRRGWLESGPAPRKRDFSDDFVSMAWEEVLDRLAGELRRVSDARLFNARGACLAAARLDDGVMQGVVHLPTGAWYDPWPGDGDRPTCVHGNPNVLTRDLGTSRLAQGSCGQVTTIQCERFTGDAPAVRAHEPPASSLAL